MVPKGWGYKKLGSVAELQRGFDLPSSKRIDGNIPIISSGGYSGFHNEAKVKAPGIVTGRYGSIGEVFFIEEDYWPLNTALWVKDFHGNDAKFLYYLLSCFDYKKFSDKTGVPGVNRNDLHAVKVGVPPLPEQRKIAQILSTWDKAITTTECLLTNRQQQKKALMQRLLTGKQRFAGFEGEWSQIFLGQVTDSFSGGTPSRSKSEYYGGNIPWIKSGEVNDRFISNVEESITQLGLDNSSAKIVPSNSILVAMYGATAGKVAINLINAAVNQAVLAIVPKENICLYFLFYFLEYQMDKTLRLVQGGQPNLNAGIIKDILINLPCLAEQQKIASVLSAADAEITTIQNQLDNLKQQKKALMQQLLTGKRRVKVDSPALATQ
jgi:type I restriction enzyme S subunit